MNWTHFLNILKRFLVNHMLVVVELVSRFLSLLFGEHISFDVKY